MLPRRSGRRTAAVLEVAAQKSVVAAVGLKKNVEDAAGEGDGSDQCVDADITEHTHEQAGRDAKTSGTPNQVERRQCGGDVSQTRDQAEDCVDPKADRSAKDAVAGVKKVSKSFDVGESIKLVFGVHLLNGSLLISARETGSSRGGGLCHRASLLGSGFQQR